MNLKQSLILLILVNVLDIANLQCQEMLNDTLVSGTLSEIVVTANRYNTLGINTPEAIRVLNIRPVEEYQLRTAPEAMTITPGVFVQKTNHGGGSPFIRGLTGNQTLLLMDGIRLSNSTMRYGPNQYFNTIDIFSLDRIEVLRGGGSVQYGSDALGGTIQAFSNELRKGDEPDWKGILTGRIATQDMEQSLRSSVGYTGRKIALISGVTLRNFGDVKGGDTTGRQTPSGYKEFDYDLKGSWFLSGKTTLTALFQNVKQKDIPIYHKIVLENYAVNRTNPQQRKLAYLRLNQEMKTELLKTLILTASFQNTGEGRESRKNGSSILRTELDKVRTLGFSAEGILAGSKNWSGNIGIDIYNDLVKSQRTDVDQGNNTEIVKRGLYPDGSSMTSIGVFTIHSYEFAKWSITAGARYNTFIINVEEKESGNVRLTPSALVGSLAIMRKLDKKSNLFLSLNTGFRAPNIDDMGTLGIVDFRYETPNYELKPESSVQYQAGYKYTGPRLRGDLFIFRNELYNIITRNRVGDRYIDGYPLYIKENSERAFIQGFETAWDYRITEKLTGYGTITYTYGQNITRDEPMRRIPPLFGRLSLEYRKDKWFGSVEWLSAGKQDRLAQGDIDDNRIPGGGTPGWNSLNLISGCTWKFITIDLSLKNIFNEDYRYHGSGINGYGRSMFLTIQLNL